MHNIFFDIQPMQFVYFVHEFFKDCLLTWLKSWNQIRLICWISIDFLKYPCEFAKLKSTSSIILFITPPYRCLSFTTILSILFKCFVKNLWRYTKAPYTPCHLALISFKVPKIKAMRLCKDMHLTQFIYFLTRIIH